MATKRIQIFKKGRHTTAAGKTLEFSDADLAAMASVYEPSCSKAPLVLGHPKTEDRAHGWADKLSVESGILVADVSQVTAEFTEAVKEGAYKHVSAAFYAPKSPSNPRPGNYYLRHIGALGATPPSVKGLAPVEFAEADDGSIEVTIEFSEAGDTAAGATDPVQSGGQVDSASAPSPAPESNGAGVDDPVAQKLAELAKREADLKAREAALATSEAAEKRAKAVEFSEGLAKAGKLLPRDKSEVTEVLLALDDASPVEFSEGAMTKKLQPAEWLRSFLGRLPVQVELKELSAPDGAEFAEGTSDEARALALAEQAKELVSKAKERGERLSLADATTKLRGTRR
ncbi:MAG: hypothetical protein LBM75_09240 [Myxococcales bacterium]|jgi:hypothetical protein|nr:hypothetical protein [Myxococcales bacterium]